MNILFAPHIHIHISPRAVILLIWLLHWIGWL